MTTAIKELSSLEEWREEWQSLSGEIKSLKVRSCSCFACLKSDLF